MQAAKHSMHEIIVTNKTKAVLLVDAENAFNSINRWVFWHNMKHICPTLATFLLNCYIIPARLFVLGGKDLLPHESTTWRKYHREI